MALYPVPAAGYNGINQNLFPFDVSSRLFREWVQITPLYNLMGNEPTRPIVRKQLSKGEGLQYRMGKLQALDYKNQIINFDQRRGNAQQQQVNYDKVDVDFKSFLVQIKGYDVLTYGTPVDLPPYARSQLVEAFSRALNYDLFNAMTIRTYPALVTGSAVLSNAAPGTFPSYDRVVFKSAAGTPIVRSIAAGAQSYYWTNGGPANGQSFPSLVNGMSTPAATAPATSGLSASHLETLKQYAERGNAPDISPGTEDAMQPAYVRNRAGWPMNKYIYLAHPQTLTSLFADPLFSNSTFYRGTVIDPENTPQTLNGADYVGEFRGISIYSCRDLYQYAITSQDGTKQAAWNLFMCAGALSLGWAEEPMLGMENDLVERIQLYFGHEFRGQKMLQFQSTYVANGCSALGGATAAQLLTVQNPFLEQGIIHSFVSF